MTGNTHREWGDLTSKTNPYQIPSFVCYPRPNYQISLMWSSYSSDKLNENSQPFLGTYIPSLPSSSSYTSFVPSSIAGNFDNLVSLVCDFKRCLALSIAGPFPLILSSRRSSSMRNMHLMRTGLRGHWDGIYSFIWYVFDVCSIQIECKYCSFFSKLLQTHFAGFFSIYLF